MTCCKGGIFMITVKSVNSPNKESYYQRKNLFGSNNKKESRFQYFQNILKEELKKNRKAR